MSAISQQPQSANTALEALEDYKRIILAHSRKENIHTGEDLAQLRDALKQKKRYGG